ncbi:hypothetical protein HDU96_007292 [Phlyctochytrium bullatum]|nr:hypothetical protein HDU96_007292 [Phlyctochytrium bullatum]
MPSLIELVPVEIARRITIHLHPEWLPNLLAASRVVRQLFTPAESELPFVRKQLKPQFEEVTAAREAFDEYSTDSSELFNMTAKVPFWKLPDVYAVGWLTMCWDCIADPVDETALGRALDYVVIVFRDLDSEGESCLVEFGHGPHRPRAWMERIVRKALRVVRMKYDDEFYLALSLASVLDSIAVVEMILWKLFPDEMKSMDSTVEPGEVVVWTNTIRYGQRLLDADEFVPRIFAWCMASMAKEAAAKGAIHLLDYALQHTQVPTVTPSSL